MQEEDRVSDKLRGVFSDIFTERLRVLFWELLQGWYCSGATVSGKKCQFSHIRGQYPLLNAPREF